MSTNDSRNWDERFVAIALHALQMSEDTMIGLIFLFVFLLCFVWAWYLAGYLVYVCLSNQGMHSHEMFAHCWVNAGPASPILSQHSPNNGSTPRSCLPGGNLLSTPTWCWFNAGTTTQTLGQHETDVNSMLLICLRITEDTLRSSPRAAHV